MHDTDADELERLILDSAMEANVLPLTSRCDSHCVFCSHKNNPPGIRTFSMGMRSLRDVTRTMAFLDPGRVITIGESATPMIEGEPLLHPDFREIIALLRRAFPDAPIEITTNGRHLSGEMVAFLETVGRLSLNISLNSASVGGRRLLMGDTRGQSEQTLAGVRLLGQSDIRFSGSIVAMPNVTGWDDIHETARVLAENGAAAIRIFMPAFSSRAKAGVFPDERDICGRLKDCVGALSAELPCPVLIEPSCVTDLTPTVSGVLRGSPAWDAGVRRDDVVQTVNGKTPRCRVEAWNMLLPEGSMAVEIARNGNAVSTSWTNGSEGDSGITMEYDFDPRRAEAIRDTVLGCPGRSLLLTSEFGHEVVRRVVELMDLGQEMAELVLIKNLTFGGTIRAAGLLTVDDFCEGYASRQGPGPAPSQILVPLESFDSHGFDLKRRHWSELQELVGVPVLLR
jgi:hypothetical protein